MRSTWQKVFKGNRNSRGSNFHRIELRSTNKEMKDTNMKRTNTLIVATLGMALFAGVAFADYQSNDGIAASPKLRETLSAGAVISPQAAPVANHRCGMCNDKYVTRADQTAKGLIKPVILVSMHQCGGCETTTSLTGQGKAAQTVVTHKCTAELASCCAPKS